jgi:hypothetical protein
MKRLVIPVAVFLAALSPPMIEHLHAQEESSQATPPEESEPESEPFFTGFFDVTQSQSEVKSFSFDGFSLGPLELDFQKSIGEDFLFSGAITFDGGGPEIAVAIFDFHAFGELVPTRGRIFIEKGFHVQVGRFDVPFGNDWLYFASVDRITVTAPLTTDLVMDGGYNDWGMRVYGNSIPLNYVVTVTRGFLERPAIVGRIGLTPFNTPYALSERTEVQPLEIGISYLHDMGKRTKPGQRVFALDLESNLGPLYFQGEFLRRYESAVDAGESDAIYGGYHLTTAMNLESWLPLPTLFYLRFGHYNQELEGFFDVPANGDQATAESTPSVISNPLDRFTTGVNINLSDIAFIKLEYVQFLKSNADFLEGLEFGGRSYNIQFVIAF